MKTIGMGIVITFIYDFILIGRQMIRHSVIGISLEDLIFWIFCAVLVFYLLYEENNGMLRWFAVAGAAAGMFLYKKLVGRSLVLLISGIFKKQCTRIGRLLWYAAAPVRKLAEKGKSWGRKTGAGRRQLEKAMKKKLTTVGKILKITISKH